VIVWKLAQFLEEHNITAYRLATETHGRLSQNAVYRLTNSDVSRFDANSLDAIIEALRKITDESVNVSDLLEYVEQ